MDNTLAYYQNENILKSIEFNTRFIPSSHDREDCRQEIFAALYDEMPIGEKEAVKLVNRIAAKFKRENVKQSKREISLKAAGID